MSDAMLSRAGAAVDRIFAETNAETETNAERTNAERLAVMTLLMMRAWLDGHAAGCADTTDAYAPMREAVDAIRCVAP